MLPFIYSYAGETLFGRSPFIRWALSPFLALFAVFMPVLVQDWDRRTTACLIVMEVMSIAMLMGFWLPRRFGRWSFRSVAAVVFAMYGEWLLREPGKALPGFIVIGLPCLRYTVTGGFLSAAWMRRLNLREPTRIGLNQEKPGLSPMEVVADATDAERRNVAADMCDLGYGWFDAPPSDQDISDSLLPIVDCHEWDGLFSITAANQRWRILITAWCDNRERGTFTLESDGKIVRSGGTRVATAPERVEPDGYSFPPGSVFCGGVWVIECDTGDAFQFSALVRDWTSTD